MSRIGKVFLYLVYCAAIAVLGGLIVSSMRSGSAAPKAETAAQHPKHSVVAASETAGSAIAKVGISSITQQSATGNTPTPLVNTGPGNLIGLFAAATAAGAILYRYRLIHRIGSLAKSRL